MLLENGKFEQCALEACGKFDDIRVKWVNLKGEQYKYGMKDSTEFRDFLIKEIHGVPDGHNTENDNPDIDRSYVGKSVSYKIVRDGGRERAINVRIVDP